MPAELTRDDHPDMIVSGQRVATIADGAVLIAYNWPENTDRYRRVETFVAAFFSKVDEFHQPPHHVKWREVNLAADLQGWNRLQSAQVWLDNWRNKRIADERTQFEAFLQARRAANPQRVSDTAAQRDQLFQEFLKWRQEAAH